MRIRNRLATVGTIVALGFLPSSSDKNNKRPLEETATTYQDLIRTLTATKDPRRFDIEKMKSSFQSQVDHFVVTENLTPGPENFTDTVKVCEFLGKQFVDTLPFQESGTLNLHEMATEGHSDCDTRSIIAAEILYRYNILLDITRMPKHLLLNGTFPLPPELNTAMKSYLDNANTFSILLEWNTSTSGFRVSSVDTYADKIQERGELSSVPHSKEKYRAEFKELLVDISSHQDLNLALNYALQSAHPEILTDALFSFIQTNEYLTLEEKIKAINTIPTELQSLPEIELIKLEQEIFDLNDTSILEQGESIFDRLTPLYQTPDHYNKAHTLLKLLESKLILASFTHPEDKTIRNIQNRYKELYINPDVILNIISKADEKSSEGKSRKHLSQSETLLSNIVAQTNAPSLETKSQADHLAVEFTQIPVNERSAYHCIIMGNIFSLQGDTEKAKAYFRTGLEKKSELLPLCKNFIDTWGDELIPMPSHSSHNKEPGSPSPLYYHYLAQQSSSKTTKSLNLARAWRLAPLDSEIISELHVLLDPNAAKAFKEYYDKNFPGRFFTLISSNL